MGGYHIDADYGLLEFDNPRTSGDNGTILARAIGTSLYNIAMPLIRYDVGDDIAKSPQSQKDVRVGGLCP